MHQETKAITIVDIAKAAGTSPATVSRVLNGSPHRINPVVRERVLAVVQELGYSPNPFGRMLKTSEMQEVAVVLPTLQNPFYIEMLSGIEQAARKCGYDVIIYNSYHSLESERQHIRSVMAKRIRMLIIAFVADETSHIEPFLAAGGMAVLLDQYTAPDEKNCISTAIDCTQGIEETLQHLTELGHKRIAYASLPLTRVVRRHQLDVFLSVCRKYGIEVGEETVLVSEQTAEREDQFYEYIGGIQLGRQLLQLCERPTAVIANNDVVAIGCMNILQEAGLRVPQDISVIGMDGISFSQMVSPALTTIYAPAFKLGETACMQLVKRMGEKSAFAPTFLRFDTRLHIGASSAVPQT